MKKNITVLLMICILSLGVTFVSAQENRVKAKISWLPDNEAEVELLWQKPSEEKLILTGWKMQDGILKLYYQTASVTGYEKRLVSVESANLPAPIRLIRSDAPETDVSQFSDLSSDKEQMRELRIATENLYAQGILSGYPDGTFQADRTVTRAEFSKMLCEALQIEAADIQEFQFQDIRKHWAKSYIQALANQDLVKGKKEGVFDPNGKITRGEMMALLHRSFYLYSRKKITQDRLPKHWSNEAYLSLKSYGIIQKEDVMSSEYKPNQAASRGEIAVLLSRILSQKHDRKVGQ